MADLDISEDLYMAELQGVISALSLGETAKRLVAQRIAQSSARHVDPKIPILRRQQLLEAFTQMDKDHSGTLTFPEVLSFLQSISEGVREDYVREIFTSMDRNGDGQVTIAEFSTAYLQQIDQVSEAAEDLKHHIGSTKEQILTAEKQLAEERNLAGTQNQYGIRTDSRLTVTVKEAQGVSAGLFRDNTYVELRFDQQSIRTANHTGKVPVWNETFEFLVERPDAVLECKVMSKDALGSFKLIGECRVEVEEIKDQKEHESWRQLEVTGKPVSAKLLLTIKLTFDRAQSLRQTIESLQTHNSQDQILLNQLQQQLTSLGTSPIGLFLRDSPQFRLETRILRSAESLYPGDLEHFCSLRSWRIGTGALLLLLGCGTAEYRSSLVDSVLLAGAAHWEIRGWSKSSLRQYLLSLVGTIGWDGVWALVLVSRIIGTNDSSALAYSVLLVLSVFLKIVLCVLLGKTHERV